MIHHHHQSHHSNNTSTNMMNNNNIRTYNSNVKRPSSSYNHFSILLRILYSCTIVIYFFYHDYNVLPSLSSSLSTKTTRKRIVLNSFLINLNIFVSATSTRNDNNRRHTNENTKKKNNSNKNNNNNNNNNSSNNNNEQKYNWKEFNYYQILGLEPANYYHSSSTSSSSTTTSSTTSSTTKPISIPNRRTRTIQRKSFSNSDIKKAYRKQAQQWHPDKIAMRNNNKKNQDNNNNNNDNTIVTIEECNERFAKIAEAYEVLTDDRKRIEYDLFLLDSEDELVNKQERLQQQQKRQEQYGRERERGRERHHEFERQQQQQQQSRRGQSSTSYYYNNDGYHYDRHYDYTDYDYDSFFHQFSLFDGFKNPMSVFEEFFFGTGGNDGPNYNNGSRSSDGRQGRSSNNMNAFSMMSDFFDSFFSNDSDNYGQSNQYFTNNDRQQKTKHRQRQYYENQQPDRISEATQARFDATIRQEVMRVLHREEYDDFENNEVYYRIIGQEFIEEFDMYRGVSLGYVPLSEPYFVEDGYTPMSEQQRYDYQQTKKRQYRDQEQFQDEQDEQSFESQQQRSSSNKQQQKRKLMRRTSSRMTTNEYISPHTNIQLKSENGQYYAGLTKDCEFVILEVKVNESIYQNYQEESLIWSSGTFLPSKYQGRGCAFAFYGGRIAVVVGDVDQPTAILWNSPLPSIVPSEADEEESINYYVSLDNDGSLAVYRTRTPIFHEGHKKYNMKNLTESAKRWFYEVVNGEAKIIPSKTEAAQAWRLVEKWTRLNLLRKPKQANYNRSSKSKRANKGSLKVDECVFATGPAGCLTPGRYVIHISKTMKRSFDRNLEDFVETVSEGSEDDIDVIDTIVRVSGKAGSFFRDMIVKTAQQNVHNFTKFFDQLKRVTTIISMKARDTLLSKFQQKV